MDAPEPPAIPATDSVPLPRIALISLLACLLFVSGMLTMYLLIGLRPGQYPPYSPKNLGDLINFYSYGLWYGWIWPVFAAAKTVVIDHAFYVVALFVLAGDRIMNAVVVVAEMTAAWRGHILMFVCGAGFVIVLSLFAGKAFHPSYTGCAPGQMLTAGGDCLWINRY